MKTLFLCAYPVLLFASCVDTNTKSYQTAVIKLDSNPTTGYSWVWVNPSEQLKLSSSKECPKTRLVGAPNTEVFIFTPQAEGTFSVSLEYKRPWEKNKPALKSYQATITVNKTSTRVSGILK